MKWLFVLLVALPAFGRTLSSQYVGREVCANCHKGIAANQITTNMANTWQGTTPKDLPVHYSETATEGPGAPIKYLVKRIGGKMEYQTQMPGGPLLTFPVLTAVGGKRHGISFLVRISSLDGLPVPGKPLIEGRYFHSSHENKLALSLGFPTDKPTNYETAFGRVLTPYLKKRCLECHVAPRRAGSELETGVTCENCHGPGRPHLKALSAHSKNPGILNPATLPIAEQWKPCTQCHAGSSLVEDPLPDQLLISDQVTAIKNSECWRQSGKRITCTNCHNPHKDAPRLVMEARAVRTCLQCHSAGVPHHAGLCPVNRKTNCVQCHMPDQVRGAFVIADHWIRAHPEQHVKVPPYHPAWRTTVVPKHEYLREIVVDSRAKAAAIRQKLLTGGSFFALARANSVDRATAINGGYLGDLKRSQFDPAWAAAALKLQPGGLSQVVDANGKYLILQRMPRNFREDAEAVFEQAMVLRKQDKPRQAMAKLIDALKIDPHLLRALTWLGALYGQAGNAKVSAGILQLATRLYPNDGGTHFNLGLAYGAMGDFAKETAEYKRTLQIDPDYFLADLNWGDALYAKGEYTDAIERYREGLAINPLSASLHYNLGVALKHENQTAEAEEQIALALKIDPTVAKP
ncbi:MAG TPA: tetratricopeptide repeat protein [Bryobacteraceae bacterium]